MKKILIILAIVAIVAIWVYVFYRYISKVNKGTKTMKKGERLIFYDDIKHLQKDAFADKVKSISEKLEIDPNWLQVVMWKESRIDSTAVNKNGGATGLIQFMPATAGALGTSTAALRSMSALEQLDYVYLYYYNLGMKGKMKSYYDLYLATFFPAAIGKPDSFVMQTSKLPAHVIADMNTGIDLNKDRKITVAEFKQYCLKGLPKDIIPYVK